MELQKQTIAHIETITGINVNTKSRKQNIVELKSVYATILRSKNQTLQSIADGIGLGHCAILHLCKLYPIIKNENLEEIKRKVNLMLSGVSLEIIELQIQEEKIEREQKEKERIEEEKRQKENIIIPDFVNDLIILANKNEDLMIKFKAFYNFNKKIYLKNES